ncbi:MAG: AI-2E family transporter, partial [Methanosarcinales archaeon]|nr:AI-2E family transporter [Methanosarcinales archaeon]
FYVVGMPHWLFAGVFMGLFNIVPYVGFLLPAIPVTVYAYTLGTEVMFAVIGIIIVIQLFDYFFILPNMVMKTVKISSFMAVILTLAGLKLAGVFGLIFAVPLYIFCKIVLISCYKMLVLMYPDPTDPNEIIIDEG